MDKIYEEWYRWGFGNFQICLLEKIVFLFSNCLLILLKIVIVLIITTNTLD